MKAVRKVTQANELIQASYRLTLHEKKLILTALSFCDSRHEIPKKITITASEFSEVSGIDINTSYKKLYEAADNLYERSIKIETNDETDEFRWIQQKITKHKGEGQITILWSDPVIKYISQLKQQFTTYNLGSVGRLNSFYSIRLYEILMQFNSTKERLITVKKFRKILGIEDKYKTWRDLRRYVIDPAVSELNQRTELVISYESFKTGRAITDLLFTFKQNNQLKMPI